MDPHDPESKVYLESGILGKIEEDLVSFLKRGKTTFKWKHEDMTGISKDIITHKLGIDRSFKPIHQKKEEVCTRKKCHYPGGGRKITPSRYD